MTGRCHWGAVSITVPQRPDYMNACNCSLCVRLGALWGYYASDEVTVTGDTSSYVRADKEPSARTHFCGKCGSTTHWSSASAANAGYAGVNMHLFDAAELAGVELRHADGRAWRGDGPFGYVRPHGVFGA